MKKHTIKTEKPGIEVYENQAFLLADEYIQGLPNPDIIYTKSAVFNGLISNIYNRMFRPYYVIHSTSNIDLSDISILDQIWEKIYSPLCSRYNKKRTMTRFCCLTGVSKTSINDWKNEKHRIDSSIETNISRSEIIQKWMLDCENDMLDGAGEENSIGSIFLLKAIYGYRDNTTVTIEAGNSGLPSQSLEQIASQFKADQLPPPIDIE